jgi:hypothetical protein
VPLGQHRCQQAGRRTQPEDSLVLEGQQLVGPHHVRAEIPVRPTAGVADQLAAILLGDKHPELAIDEAIPIPHSWHAPIRVVTATADAFPTTPAAIARVVHADVRHENTVRRCIGQTRQYQVNTEQTPPALLHFSLSRPGLKRVRIGSSYGCMSISRTVSVVGVSCGVRRLGCVRK